jgi:hypothetical protein
MTNGQGNVNQDLKLELEYQKIKSKIATKHIDSIMLKGETEATKLYTIVDDEK